MKQDDDIQPFGNEYWRQEGGQKWVENIDYTERVMVDLNRRLMESAIPAKGEFVLDVGCGGGKTSIEIANLTGTGGSVLGIDISGQIIEIAYARGRDISNLVFREEDAEKADLGECVFDLITSRFGVMFFEDPNKAFRNLYESLKPGGRLVMLVWRTMSENVWMYEPAAAVAELMPKDEPAAPPAPDAPGPFSLGDPAHVKKLLSESGFQKIQLEAIDAGLPMGTVNEAAEFLTKMGPAAALLEDADEEQKSEAVQVIKDTISKYESADGVALPAAAWIVKASR